MKKRVVVLANKDAGTKLRFLYVYRALKKKLKKKKIGFTQYSKIEEVPERELRQNTDYMIIMGGDGTLNFAVNYLYKRKIKIPLGIIPVGSSNVFAQAVGIPLRARRAIKTAIKKKVKAVPIGVINNEKVFLVATTTGVHSDLLAQTPRRVKMAIGQIAYFFRLPLHLMRIKKHKYNLEIPKQGKVQVKASAIFIINGLPKIYRGVFKRINSFEPKLYTLIVESARPVEVARTFNAMYIQRKNPVKGVRYFESSVVLLEAKKAPFSVDGELIKAKKIKAEVNNDFFQFKLP